MMLVLDYGMGNIGSVGNALQRIGIPFVFSADPAAIAEADHLILAGVGAFDHGMTRLQSRGLIPLLEQKVRAQGTPLLGLCLGAQLLTRGSEEGTLPGLGWIPADTIRFAPDVCVEGKIRKIPHMGWNTLKHTQAHPLLEGISQDDPFYFMHSYHLSSVPAELVLATTEYGEAFPSVVASNTIAGIQCHPEKSREAGLRFLRNFAAW